MATPAAYGYGFAQLMTISVVSCGAPMVINGHLTVGTLIACVLLSGQVMQPLQRALALWVRFQDIALARIAASVRAAGTCRGRDFLPVESLTANHGTVNLESVQFGYQPDKPVFTHAFPFHCNPETRWPSPAKRAAAKPRCWKVMAGIYPPDDRARQAKRHGSMAHSGG